MLGLLSGFSFISIVEIVYIFVLKPILSLKCMRSNQIAPETEDGERRKKNFIAEYLTESSVHSFHYFVNEKRWVEK
jgi:F0F1-type ATP synthase membrane subunit b/b'